MNDTTTARDILIEAMRRRIRLTPNGGKLVIDSVGELDPAFESVLRQSKPALLELLRAKRHLARQVLQGEFVGVFESMWLRAMEDLSESLDPLCRQALNQLRKTRRQMDCR